MKRIYDIGMERVNFEEKLRQLRHKIECNNIANLMGLLCMERRKCLQEKNNIENFYKSEIAKLTSNLCVKNERVKHLTKALNESKKEVNLREQCILEILKQFQKFVYFALRAVPTQAEFLLSIEKLMIFELTDHLLKIEQVSSPCETTLKWTEPRHKSKEQAASLELQDGHNCMKEIHVASPDDILPSFVFRDKLYIRQEFRDVLANFEGSDQSKELWLNDEENVQMLVTAMKESVKSDECIEAKDKEYRLVPKRLQIFLCKLPDGSFCLNGVKGSLPQFFFSLYSKR